MDHPAFPDADDLSQPVGDSIRIGNPLDAGWMYDISTQESNAE